jgi:hypothetical protein
MTLYVRFSSRIVTTLYGVVCFELSFLAMPTTIEELERLMQAPREVEGLEFKAARTGFDGGRLMDYCVGIANDGGGKLIFRDNEHTAEADCGNNSGK